MVNTEIPYKYALEAFTLMICIGLGTALIIVAALMQ